MATPKGALRICSNGHRFYKSSSCPVCPTCESEKGRRPEFGKLSSPANRALENAGIKTLLELSKYSEDELLQLHGIGPNAISTLKQTLKRNGFSLKKIFNTIVMQSGDYKTIAQYIALFPKDVQAMLKEVKLTIAKAAPKAVETISYAIPTFKLNGRNLVHFAGYKSHIGFYPGSKAVEVFAGELTKYKTAKGSIQFPIETKMPLLLITKITKYRVEVENKRLSIPKSKKVKPSNKK